QVRPLALGHSCFASGGYRDHARQTVRDEPCVWAVGVPFELPGERAGGDDHAWDGVRVDIEVERGAAGTARDLQNRLVAILPATVDAADRELRVLWPHAEWKRKGDDVVVFRE